MTEQPSTVYKDANQFLNSLHKARASRPSSVLLSLQTPNTGTAQTFPRRISTNHSPLPHLHLKKPTGPLRHPPHQENPDEQAEKDLVTKQYEEANQYVTFKVHDPLPLTQTLIKLGSFECSNSSVAHHP